MRKAGYDDVERGERGSSEKHLTVTQFKVEKEQARLADLQEHNAEMLNMAAQLISGKEAAEKEVKQAQAKLDKVAPMLKNMEKLAAEFPDDSDKALPPADVLESAKSYREKKAIPLFKKIVKDYDRVKVAYGPERVAEAVEVVIRQEQTQRKRQNDCYRIYHL